MRKIKQSKFFFINITQLLQNCIGPTIRIGRESWLDCLKVKGLDRSSRRSHKMKNKGELWVG